MKGRLADVIYSSIDQCGEDKLERTIDAIDKLCKKYPWLRELGKGYMIKKSQGISPHAFLYLLSR